MPSFVQDFRVWLRHSFAWSNSADAWRERVVLVGWLGGVIAWWFWFAAGDYELGPWKLAAAAGLGLALAFLARRGWLQLFGPVLFYEALRAARRTRFFVLRLLYAVALLLLLLWVHSIWMLEYSFNNTGQVNDYKMQAQLAQQYFYAFAVAQFLVVVALTPAYVAGGIAEEKERKTLEFLLASDLRNREIVFGKVAARLGNLGLFLITGLPILSLMQFFGGIDPVMLLASFALTALTACSLAGLGILISVQRRRARDAIVLTYLVTIAYCAVSSASNAIPLLIKAYRSSIGRQANYLWEDGVDWLVEVANYGNPFKGFYDIMWTINTPGGVLADTLVRILDHYSIFHGTAAIAMTVWAVVRLRRIALSQTSTPAQTKKTVWTPRRRPVGARPVLWKEIWIEGRLRFGWMGRIFIGLLVLGSFVPVILMAYFIFFDGRGYSRYGDVWREFSEGMNVWLRSMNVIVSLLMLLGVAVRAAGSISGERDRDTLLSLMGTPLTTAEIFWSKWWGSLVSVRFFAVWLGTIWLLTLVTGGVNILAILLQFVAWIGPAMCLASLGLYFSSACKTSLRAMTWTLLLAAFALGGHWIAMGMCCFAPMAIMLRNEPGLEVFAYLELGLTPPIVFGWLPCRDLDDLIPRREAYHIGFGVLGHCLWFVGAIVIGHMAHDRFRRLTNRNKWIHTLPPGKADEPPVVTAAPESEDEPPTQARSPGQVP